MHFKSIIFFFLYSFVSVYIDIFLLFFRYLNKMVFNIMGHWEEEKKFIT